MASNAPLAVPASTASHAIDAPSRTHAATGPHDIAYWWLDERDATVSAVRK